ncbi:MAG: Phosphate binding protein [Candidatus Syntrophoarchaeum caldarius]|uniref:Phosphate binding protein n=1 Tax=Candidatus Syntropharchaeum caldarium TaxID=1838285 RepID=A0A1F2PDG9_9EURY|nr:MAG: Phosphate binding protein [Candidatus Syntrophoarchaeum caldarius]
MRLIYLKNQVIAGLALIIVIISSGCIGNDSVHPANTLVIKGSDTLVQLVSDMAEVYMNEHPYADISVTGGGSGTGIAALINGEVDIADSSRRIKDSELKKASARGIEIREFIIARDGLCIIVHPSNPVEKLTLEEVGAIYRGEITNWKEVGGDDRDITLYGRQSTSGTYEFMREYILKADYSPDMLNMEGNKAIVDGIKTDKNGIGYIGIGYLVDGVKPLDLAVNDSSEYVSPLEESAVEEGVYPLSRPLYQYTNGLPEVDSIAYSFLKFELSDEGLEIIRNAGYYPPNPEDRMNNDEKFRLIED